MKRAALLIGILFAALLCACGTRNNGGRDNEGGQVVYVTAKRVDPTEAPATEPNHTDEPDPTGIPAATETATAAAAQAETELPEVTEEARTTETPAPAQTDVPTAAPTSVPTGTRSPEPTKAPTQKPTETPTNEPTAEPTPRPKVTPSPTPAPTPEPTEPPDYSSRERAISPVDFNENGIDDYTDILNGARKDAINHPRYDPSYQRNGYPPDDVGVCADVIWRAFREAGYSLRYMVDKDIRDNTWRYPEIYNKREKRDNKIDFRRVRNLRIFFDEYAISLTTDIYDIEEWQPGDIVIFNKNTHIGIVSDKRNDKGIPYIIHNGGQEEREQDYLEGDHKVAAHFRFDASRVPEEMLIPWEGD